MNTVNNAMTERGADWSSDVPNVNFPHIPFYFKSIGGEKSSHLPVKCWLIIVTLTVFITCYLNGLTDKLRMHNDPKPECAQPHRL